MKKQVKKQKKWVDGIKDLIMVIIMILNPSKDTKGIRQLVTINPSVSISIPINIKTLININYTTTTTKY